MSSHITFVALIVSVGFCMGWLYGRFARRRDERNALSEAHDRAYRILLAYGFERRAERAIGYRDAVTTEALERVNELADELVSANTVVGYVQSDSERAWRYEFMREGVHVVTSEVDPGGHARKLKERV